MISFFSRHQSACVHVKPLFLVTWWQGSDVKFIYSTLIITLFIYSTLIITVFVYSTLIITVFIYSTLISVPNWCRTAGSQNVNSSSQLIIFEMKDNKHRWIVNRSRLNVKYVDVVFKMVYVASNLFLGWYLEDSQLSEQHFRSTH